jgi:NAD(P)-dependent dehydrogenase (short-subunit alcohol dehydrogenase family)
MKKTVLITGCSSGIGKASAKLFASKGWNVAPTMRKPEAAADLARLDNVLVARLDVQDRAGIEAALKEALARFERIDALVNNAGYGQYGVFEAIPREKIQEQFDVNLFGLMDVTRALLPHFRAHKAGLIINVSSGAGLFTLPMTSVYCASKFALEGFSEALAYELASQNVAVKIVEPHGGVTDTRFYEKASWNPGKDNLPPGYGEFAERTKQAFARIGAARTISPDDVARTIYEAATDGTDRLRYLVGDDTRGFIQARQKLSDQAYVEFMRSRFLSKPCAEGR